MPLVYGWDDDGIPIMVEAGGGGVPLVIAAGDTYTVGENTQTLFCLPVTVDGMLVLDGLFVEVL